MTPNTPPRANYDRPPKPSIGQRLAEWRKPLAVVALVLVVLALIGSAGMFISRAATSPKPVAQTSASQPSPPAPLPNPSVGEVTFVNSDQIGADNSTGVADQIQVNLKNLTSPATGNSYYAWLLPDPGNTSAGKNILLGPLTINNGTASLSFANPTHENLLLTESTFLITEESSNPAPSIPSPDQHTWRYLGSIPQTPNPQDPNHFSNLDHIRQLLGSDPAIQKIGLQGGLSTWFYTNVQKVLQLSSAAQEADGQQSVFIARRNLISILDLLDGVDNVAADVPSGTPIDVNQPEIAKIPLLTLDPNQTTVGYIDRIETDLQELTASPDATDIQRTTAAQIDKELGKIASLLQKVRDDAKQLAKLTFQDLLDPKNAPTFTDMVDNANAALIGQLDPTTNTRKGGATFVHDIMPQIATINVTAFKLT